MNEQHKTKPRIAVIGGGVAGIVTAWMLQHKYQVCLFEQNDYLGGHTNTIEITEGLDAGLAVDTGFIVLNDATYPLFQRFLAQLGVATRNSEMSFGFECKQTGLVYAGNTLGGLFAQRSNLISPRYYRFLFEIVRFGNKALQELEGDRIPQITLGEYLQRGGYSSYLIDNYLLPIAAAIWSTPAMKAADFPAAAFLRFFRNHGLLSLRNRPQWMTVAGGSFAYVKAFQQKFHGEIKLNAGVEKIVREENRVRLDFKHRESQVFDQVVIATHADQALHLLGDADDMEERLLSAWTYQSNRTVLHTDDSLLPRKRAAWSAWNFTRTASDTVTQPVFVTYYMNLLQGLQAERNYCVTLNPPDSFAAGSVLREFDYQHPQYTFDSLETQAELPNLNGRRGSWFCGSYFGYGFHEDAVRSAVAVGKSLGGQL